MRAELRTFNFDAEDCKLAVLNRKESRRMNPVAKPPDETSYSGRLAARLRALREKNGLSVPEVVEKLTAAGYAIGVQTYYGWENGKRQVNWDAIPALAKTLKVKISELVPPK